MSERAGSGLGQAIDTPWKAWNAVLRWLSYPQVWLLFAMYSIPWKRGWRFYGVPIVHKHRGSEMRFGPGLELRSMACSNPLGPNHPVILTTWQASAELIVGANLGMTGGSLCAAERVWIGDNVTVGANTVITDTDFHSLDAVQRKSEPTGGETVPVTIQDDVFIGMNCLILKGVTIGRSSIVGAGSVVTKDVPSSVIVAGNPATIVRDLTREAAI